MKSKPKKVIKVDVKDLKTQANGEQIVKRASVEMSGAQMANFLKAQLLSKKYIQIEEMMNSVIDEAILDIGGDFFYHAQETQKELAKTITTLLAGFTNE
jgi:hypothetical protein